MTNKLQKKIPSTIKHQLHGNYLFTFYQKKYSIYFLKNLPRTHMKMRVKNGTYATPFPINDPLNSSDGV